MRFLQPPRKILYLKEFPFHFNERAKQRTRIIGQFLGIVLLTAFIAYIFLNNITPFGVTMHYALGASDQNISDIGPAKRVNIEIQNGQRIFHQTDDLAYFTTKMPFVFDEATVIITFKNSSPDQTLALGFKDQKIWHYDTKPFDVPYLNALSWETVGNNPVLYQRGKHFNSVDDFLANPPKDLLIGTYDYETGFEKSLDPQLSDYSPASQDTIIDVPLRGKHTLYAYLENEPFKMTIQKQDLNWYEDPDTMTVKVYKDEDLVFQLTADDDGIIDSSKKTLPAEEIIIKNPGPDLPESGIYKIVIEGNDDSIIKRITTNLHKIVFANSLFPVANKDAYSPLISSTSATTIYTNALLLSALTHHEAGLQTIQVGSKSVDIDMIKINKNITPPDIITKVVLPKNDAILNGFQGYFAFEENQFFVPTPYRIVPISKKEDIEIVDYILSGYQPSTNDGEWQVNKLTFDLRSSVIKNGKLSWIIKAPGLKDNDREIIIKDIKVILHKKPWM